MERIVFQVRLPIWANKPHRIFNTNKYPDYGLSLSHKVFQKKKKKGLKR
jgi:hypothetical protein